MNINEYIKSIEDRDGVFSKAELTFIEGNLLKNFNSKKMKVVYERTKMEKIGKLMTTEVIFETAQKFLIHLEDDNPVVSIYYKPEQQKELIFFINQTFKGYKNDTTNN